MTKRTFPKFRPSVYVYDARTGARVPLAEAPAYVEPVDVVRAEDGVKIARVERYMSNGAPRYLVDVLVAGVLR